MATLQNLSDEPANVIQFTIVENCIDTLFRVASADSISGEETDLLCFMAKNTLATLSHWFRKIATGGAERARLSEIASSGVRGITSSSKGYFLHNATLHPTLHKLWS